MSRKRRYEECGECGGNIHECGCNIFNTEPDRLEGDIVPELNFNDCYRSIDSEFLRDVDEY